MSYSYLGTPWLENDAVGSFIHFIQPDMADFTEKSFHGINRYCGTTCAFMIYFN